MKKILERFSMTKQNLCLTCKNSWPIHASFEEDLKLRDPVWTQKISNARLIMWDDTNLDFNHKTSLAKTQRITHSS